MSRQYASSERRDSQTMRNCENSRILKLLPDHLLQLRVECVVERRRRLVENDDARVAEEAARWEWRKEVS